MFYKNLSKVRAEKKVSQTKIAEILNTTQQQISKYEKGVQEIPTRHIITLAEFYKVSADYLLGITAEETKSEISIMYEKLTEKNKGKAELYIEQLLEQQEEQQAQAKEIA